jgi:hypothetical protein
MRWRKAQTLEISQPAMRVVVLVSVADHRQRQLLEKDSASKPRISHGRDPWGMPGRAQRLAAR